MKLLYNFLLLPVGLLFLMSCKKFLDEKSDKHLVVPTSLNDLQSLLNSDFKMNAGYPVAGEIAADNYYLSDADWSSLTNLEVKNLYIWDKDIANETDWRNGYDQVFNCNAVLDNVENIKITTANETQWNQVKGSALFFRGHCFYQLAQIFTPPYEPASSQQALGIPLRLTADINDPTIRLPLLATYDRILADLLQAASLLPATSTYKTQPNKAAAFAQLARTYLIMKDFVNAGKYADSCLQINASLINFNTISATSSAPFVRFNTEVIFHTTLQSATSLTQARCKVDTNLYRSYAINDLRKSIYFKLNTNGSYSFKGSYSGSNSSSFFGGIAIDEIYLIRAECFARNSNVSAAISDLNSLLITRWKTGTFIPLNATTTDDALRLVLQERRKELCFRSGLRWIDLRRLNTESQFKTSIKRNLNGLLYELPADDLRYTCLIPQSVINLTGIRQNKR